MKRSTFVFLILSFVLFARISFAQQPPPIPLIDKPMRVQLRNVFLAGTAQGNQPAVFAKVGDSITRNKAFLIDIGCQVEVLAGYLNLAPTIDFFRNTSFPDVFTVAWCGDANSFTRDSITAANGWTAAEPLRRFPRPISICPSPDNVPLRCEFRLIKPSIALIMLGTNDLEENNPNQFRKNLTAIVQETLIAGVVPVISTIPPRLDNPVMNSRVGPYNKIIQDVATTLQVPLWNYWTVLTSSGMINQGMDKNGIHPSIFNGNEAAVFTSTALRYGFNQRNLTAVQVLKKIRAVVENNAPSDSSSLPNFTIFPIPLSTKIRRGGKSITVKIRIEKLNTTAPITLKLSAPPLGITGTFVTNAIASSAILTLTASTAATTGKYRITVQGKDGTLTRTTAFALKVHN